MLASFSMQPDRERMPPFEIIMALCFGHTRLTPFAIEHKVPGKSKTQGAPRFKMAFRMAALSNECVDGWFITAKVHTNAKNILSPSLG